jgi:hypothetical protein
MTYEDAERRGYDGPPPGRERRRARANSCSDGYCGARDCPACYPDTWDDDCDDGEG